MTGNVKKYVKKEVQTVGEMEANNDTFEYLKYIMRYLRL